MAKINVIYEAWYFDLDCGHSIPGGVAPDVQAIGDEADCPVCVNNEKQVKAAVVKGMKIIRDSFLHSHPPAGGAIQAINKLIDEDD